MTYIFILSKFQVKSSKLAMRLRSRKRERPLSGKRNTQVTKLKNKPINKPLSKANLAWNKILKRDSAKNGNLPETTQFCITRSQKNLKTRPVRTTIIKRMEKPVETLHKNKPKLKETCTKKPIFQTVVRSTNKDAVSSSTSVKSPKTQNDKVTTTSKPKEVRTTKSVQLRHSSLNRELRKTDGISSAMNSPRKTRRLDKADKSASLNSSPIRKVRQMGAPSPKITKVTSTNESPKKKAKAKALVVPEATNWSDDNDVTMYEPHTTTFVDFPTPKSDESDSDVQVESSELCLPNDCLNDFITIAECARIMDDNLQTEDEVNFLADKAARVMTTDKDEGKKSRKNSVEKRLIKRRKSSNDLEMYQPTSTTDDMDSCTDFLSNGEKYVQVIIVFYLILHSFVKQNSYGY